MQLKRTSPMGWMQQLSAEPGAHRSPWVWRASLLVCALLATWLIVDESVMLTLLRRARVPEACSQLASNPAAASELVKAHSRLQPPWRAYYSSLSDVSVGGVTAYAALHKQLSWQFTLQPDELRRAATYTGAAHRLRLLMHELEGGARASLRVAVVGGSISWGSAVDRGTSDWFSLVTEWLRSAYPHVNITGKNGCVPATPSAFMELCLEKHMGDDADLVFMEYATNDGSDFADADTRKTFERLLRKVMRLPSKPAVVLVHLPTKGQAFDAQNQFKRWYYETVEDVYGAFASYYQVPSLSLRNAVWHISELHQRGGNWSDWYGDWHDYVHPVTQGHKAIADMVVWQWQRMSLGLLLEPLAQQEREVAQQDVPVPMYTDNYEGATRACLHGAEFKAIVQEARGFELVNEGDDIKQKWGYVATQPGSRLVFAVNTTRITHPEQPTMNVLMAFLKSYEHMGVANVTCEGGCKCKGITVDAHHEQRVSTIHLLTIVPTQAPRCKIAVTLLANTTSGEHKFKVTGVMASESRDRSLTYLTREDFMGHVNHGGVKPYEGRNNNGTTTYKQGAQQPPQQSSLPPSTPQEQPGKQEAQPEQSAAGEGQETEQQTRSSRNRRLAGPAAAA